MRIEYGPGYRIYYQQMGFNRITHSFGGDMSSQAKNIDEALLLADKPYGEDQMTTTTTS